MKSFWETKKTVEDQGEKQIRAIQDQGQRKTIKNIFIMLKILHLSPNEKK